MFRHDPQHTGYTDCEMPDELELLWKYKTGGRVASSPAVVNDKVYFGSWDTYFYCLDTNGNLLWKYKSSWIYSSPAVVNDKVYFGSDDDYLYCLDTNGNLLWKYETGSLVSSSPAVVNDKVYFGSGDTYLYCLYTNGNLLWKYKTGDSVHSSPAVVDGKIYFGSNDCYVYCLGEKENYFVYFGFGTFGIIIIAISIVYNLMKKSKEFKIKKNEETLKIIKLRYLSSELLAGVGFFITCFLIIYYPYSFLSFVPVLISMSLFFSFFFVSSLFIKSIKISYYSIVLFIVIIAILIFFRSDLVIWKTMCMLPGLLPGTLLLPFALSRLINKIKKRSYFVSISLVYSLAATLMLAYLIESITCEETIFNFYISLPLVILIPLISYRLYDKALFHFEKKPEEKPKLSKEEISPKLKKLLQERDEWRAKLEDLKREKEDLIKRGLMSEKTYQQRYEEIMDKLVDIEDKIIQEKMKGGVKK